jgi:class 3 adenylate cyclase
MARLGSGIPASGKTHTLDLGNLAFRFLVAIDVEGFGQRHAAEQARVQNDLENTMAQAAANVRLTRERWYRQPGGDGELAVLPPGINGLHLVAEYPRRLAATVAEVNLARNSMPRLRIRLAIHHGAVMPGRFGPVGATVVVSRLVDAEVLRQHLRRRSDLDVALIVSATVYDEVVKSRLNNLNPEAFRRVIIRAKGSSYTGYLYQGTFATQNYMVPPPRERSVTV